MIRNPKNIMANTNENQREPRKTSCKLREDGIKCEKAEISISFEFDAHKADRVCFIRRKNRTRMLVFGPSSNREV
jgi:hypothetical protein